MLTAYPMYTQKGHSEIRTTDPSDQLGSLVRISEWPYCVYIQKAVQCFLNFAAFLSYGDLLARNCLFFLPNSQSAPPLHNMFPLEFRAEVNHEQTRVMLGLSFNTRRSRHFFLKYTLLVFQP